MIAVLITILLPASIPHGQQADAHPLAFWRSIVEHRYEVPPGADVASLTMELETLLASPDPELRDEIAYSTLASWIYQQRLIEAETLRPLVERLLGNLRKGIGERESDGVFRRSFSALVLSVIVARDNVAPFLAAPELRRIEDAALAYLDAERDLRGYDEKKGWIHSAAHAADLLTLVARSRHLEARDQSRILDAISAKLADAAVVFTHGEDERLARTILSIVDRADFDRGQFAAWSQRAKPLPVSAERPTPAQLAAFQNAKNLFAKLETLLAVQEQSESTAWAVDTIRAALKDTY
jgi:hypothetical protein